MPEIIPIRDLKNTNAISQRCHEMQEPMATQMPCRSRRSGA